MAEKIEEVKVKGEDLLKKVKELIHEHQERERGDLYRDPPDPRRCRNGGCTYSGRGRCHRRSGQQLHDRGRKERLVLRYRPSPTGRERTSAKAAYTAVIPRLPSSAAGWRQVSAYTRVPASRPPPRVSRRSDSSGCPHPRRSSSSLVKPNTKAPLTPSPATRAASQRSEPRSTRG